jgi:hypothetical protein
MQRVGYWDIPSIKDCGFEYLANEDKEFLIFNTNDFHSDAKPLYKKRRLTGMRLAQKLSINCYAQLWLYRPSNLTYKNG